MKSIIGILMSMGVIILLMSNTSQTTSPEELQLNPATPDGEALYKQHCISCHQADGSGVPSMYPPLKKDERVNGEPEPLIKVMMLGNKANFLVDKDEYMGAMASYKFLSDEKIASLLTYIRTNFSNEAGPIKPETVKEVRSSIE